MKVLLVNHFPLQGSGSGIYTLNVARELIKEGHEVFVIDIDNSFDNTKYGFKRKTIICDRNKNADSDLDFDFPCFTTHPRSKLTYYDLTSEQILQYVEKYCETVNEVCAEFHPDIIHTQHLWIAPYAAMNTGIPYVITAHGTDLMGFKKDKRYHHYALEGARKAGNIIAISKQVANDVNELFTPESGKLFLNPNGFSEKIFRIKKVNKREFYSRFKIPEMGTQMVSFVGKFTNFKGIDILIDAIPKVNKRIRNVDFLLAGFGELHSSMIKRAEDYGISNCFFLGHLGQDDVANLYNLAALSIVPSRIEPFGLVAIEALACGTPVVATRAGGLPDFINSEIGQLVEMNDPDALALAIIHELNDNTKISKGKKAAEYALENYSWHKTLKNVIELYKKNITANK